MATTRSPSPSAYRISVLLGASETMRAGERASVTRRPASSVIVSGKPGAGTECCVFAVGTSTIGLAAGRQPASATRAGNPRRHRADLLAREHRIRHRALLCRFHVSIRVNDVGPTQVGDRLLHAVDDLARIDVAEIH